ncbi:penicillin-binding transpeptidase domain-containing protein [Paenibacillus chungangensis]|uniref:Penicillin-binding transpeptidase domain-containing protein n=1 Tax=Paenibacillus chungangensis TaxID=696535 RepID=A0ABW3HS33_9BACL
MEKRVKLRTLLFGGVMTLLFLVLIGRIYYVQVVSGAEWYDMAKVRWSASEELKAKRGSVTDRNGNVLAMDTIAYNVAVNPKMIVSHGIEQEVVDGLHDILGISKDDLMEHVTAKNAKGEYYSHREIRKGGWQIEKALADEIYQFRDELIVELRKEKKTPDTGIYLQETLKRYYPRQTLASQVIGYISLDGQYMSGVEAYFNDRLTGEDGYMRYEKDGKRVQLSNGEVDYKPAKDGQDIQLTIDNDIQHIVEETLREVMEKYSPKSATAIAADPKTMEILAMANMPEFNPNEYGKSDYASFYNHAVGSLYEPGSTFKIVTLASAIEEGVFNPNEMYMSGSITVPGEPRPIRDHNRVGWGQITFLDGLIHSSNVAFVKLGFERLGKDKLREYFTNFGFGQKTGIQIGNELAGDISFHWNREVADATFGQGVAVTPIQQVAAVAAVANGGRLMQPQLVKSFKDPITKTTTVIEPVLVRQVISEESSRQTSEYLEQVVSDMEKGTGRRAHIEGYRVAGKTGTAQKWVDGEYSTTKFLVSFIGYAPVENPQIVIYIAVDEPSHSYIGGGSAIAAPAFREIMMKSLRKLDVPPSYEVQREEAVKETMVVVPKLTALKVSQAKAELNAKEMAFEVIGDGGAVLQQIPAAESVVHPSQRVYLITEQRDKLSIPDLTGVSLRDAIELTSLIGARLVPEGGGYVRSQEVEELGDERIVKVKLAPPPGSEEYRDASEEVSEGSEASSEEEEDSGQAQDDGVDVAESTADNADPSVESDDTEIVEQ